MEKHLTGVSIDSLESYKEFIYLEDKCFNAKPKTEDASLNVPKEELNIMNMTM